MDCKDSSPSVVVVAGPNGAGKSTTAEALLSDTLALEEFVNADVIARGLSGFAGEGAAVAVGRIMLARMRELAARRVSFAFETTMASRALAARLLDLRSSGYRIHIVYLWLGCPELALLRVRQRVRAGGLGVPEKTVRRRYGRSLTHFFELYRPLAAFWRAYENGTLQGPRLVARGRGQHVDEVLDAETWRRIQSARDASGARPQDPRAHDDG